MRVLELTVKLKELTDNITSYVIIPCVCNMLRLDSHLSPSSPPSYGNADNARLQTQTAEHLFMGFNPLSILTVKYFTFNTIDLRIIISLSDDKKM